MQEQLNWPYHWLDLASMHWAKEIQKNHRIWEKSLSKDAIAKANKLPPEEKPHNALGGVIHIPLQELDFRRRQSYRKSNS